MNRVSQAACGASAPPGASARYPTRVLVLGLGNDVLSDDAIGLHVARQISKRCAAHRDIVVRETMEMGLALLDEIVGCEHLILVDAIVTGNAPPGTVHELSPAQLRSRRNNGPHFVGVMETLALGATLGLAMPRHVRIFAVEVADALTLGTQLTPAIEAVVEPAAVRIAACAEQFAART